MRIGGSNHLPQLPQQLPQRQPVAPTSGSSDQTSSASKSSPAKSLSAPSADFATEFAKTRAGQSTGQSTGPENFYSTDRSLSLKGQAAMETYITNAGFQFGSNQAEWVGVDTFA